MRINLRFDLNMGTSGCLASKFTGRAWAAVNTGIFSNYEAFVDLAEMSMNLTPEAQRVYKKQDSARLRITPGCAGY